MRSQFKLFFTLLHFSETSGMQVNEGKSAIFFSGTKDEDKQQILDLLRFPEGRYYLNIWSCLSFLLD